MLFQNPSFDSRIVSRCRDFKCILAASASTFTRDNSSRVEFELPMLEVWVRVPVVATTFYNSSIFATLVPLPRRYCVDPTSCKIRITRRSVSSLPKMSSRTQSEALVRSWGFKTVFIWTDGSYSLPSPPPASHPPFPYIASSRPLVLNLML